MKRSITRSVCFGLALAFLISSCASLKLVTVWKDDAYQAGAAKKVFVMGVTQREDIRHILENGFVNQLKARGIEAVASHTVLPFEMMVERDVITSKVKESGADAVLSTRLIDRRGAEQTGAGKTQYDYYGRSFGYDEPPAYIARGETSVIRTNLVDAKTENRVWSAEVETGQATVDADLVQSYIRIIMDRLIADRMIR